MNRIPFCILLALCAASARAQATATAPVPAAATPTTPGSGASAPPAPHKLAAARAVMIFHCSLSSKSATVGKQCVATLETAITLPGGVTLPKGTPITGTVAGVSRHSKEKPNGAIELNFDRANPKGGEPIPLIVRILTLSPPIGSDTKRTTLPNSNGNMVATTANSGGLQEQSYEGMDHTASLAGKYKDISPLDGVFVFPTKETSGAAFSLNDDIYLDSNIQITVLMAASTAAPR